MKKILVLFLVLAVAGGAAFAQQSPDTPDPSGSFTFNIGYSLFAPIGVSLEFFPSQSIGIGGMLNGFFFGAGGGVVWSVNPGGFIRLYFSELDGTMYLNAGVSYLTAGYSGGGSSDWLDGGIMQVRGGLGYNNIFGRRNQNRIQIELGAVYQHMVSGDDDDDYDAQEQSIIAIVEEMTAGQMERTVAGLEDKVFPHVSEDYAYAGRDKTALMEDALEELAESPNLTVTGYDLTVAVEIEADGMTARAETLNEIQMLQKADDDIGFDLAMTGTIRGVSLFALEDDGWKVVSGEAQYNEYAIAGGDENLAMVLDAIEVDAQEVGPGESVNLTGSLTLPAVAANQLLYVIVSASWGDERFNAVQWDDENETVLMQDITDEAGGAFTFNLKLPDDTEPAGLSIPNALPMGEDAVEIAVTLFVLDDTGELVRGDGRIFSLPFAPLSNADPCNDDLTVDADGLWLLHFTDPLFAAYEILDLRQIEQDLYGASLLAYDDSGTYLPGLFLLTGQNVDNAVTLDMENDDFDLTYEAIFSDGLFTDGEATYTSLEGTITRAFVGRKLDNRCVGLNADDLDGASLMIDTDEMSPICQVTEEDAQVWLNCGNIAFTGYVIRNVLIAIDDVNNDQTLILGFYDDEQGYAAILSNAAGDIAEGSFTML